MERLLVIADDFTGALDTGVQFTDRGAVTQVVMDPGFDFSKADPEVQVIVLNMESRHIPTIDAYKLVYRAVENAVKAGIRYIYKKTDSGLRGNIGAELSAALEASGRVQMIFAPAFPRLNRNTMGGVHYIDGIPVEESMFGNDPIDPVTKSRVSDIIRIQSGIPCVEHGIRDIDFSEDIPGIHIMDASSEEDLRIIAEGLGKDRLYLCAGCAAFAGVFAQAIGISGEKSVFPPLPTNLFMACGSVNPITLTQMDNGERFDFIRVHLSPEQKLQREWVGSEEGGKTLRSWIVQAHESGRFILDANDPEGSTALQDYMKQRKITIETVRETIAPQVGHIVRAMLDLGLDATLLCTGGDTLVSFMNEVGINSLRPIAEISTGCVLTSFEYNGKLRYVITKSGGFGTPDLLLKLCDRIQETNG